MLHGQYTTKSTQHNDVNTHLMSDKSKTWCDDTVDCRPKIIILPWNTTNQTNTKRNQNTKPQQSEKTARAPTNRKSQTLNVTGSFWSRVEEIPQHHSLDLSLGSLSLETPAEVVCTLSLDLLLFSLTFGFHSVPAWGRRRGEDDSFQGRGFTHNL